ncbi:hypothetical protein NBH00_09265 [Paraconexibacter antarcticus]|uniref:Uncharacterized protein n=1 Tax=Paraconexibacter antarcticus TaxID=2949664 RepID=A0ABY5DZW9_9ACTN|nr:hypothetical protein [Paraconexibacter antarcticus]UTI66382.1 hypothetical protein NBH00_09265 [Paraconexibacter antarcticus]
MLTTRLGWFGAVAYALPILEVWLLGRLSERGATALLVVLQVAWVLALLAVLDRCLRGSPAWRRARDAAAAEAALAESAAIDPDAEASPRPAAARPRRLTVERRRSHR